MPLPEGGKTAWPPEHCAPINARIAEWAAWYEGSIEKLTAMYGGPAENGSDNARAFFGSETGARGIINRALSTARRWFWGSANRSGAARNRVHAPLAGEIASASADLLYGDPPTVTAAPLGNDTPDTATQERLDILVDDGMHATWIEAADIAAGLGGVYLRVCWDDPAERPDPWIAAVYPDAAAPEFRLGKLSAVTFWRIVAQNRREVIRHLERHERGRISHGVYVGDEDTLGVRVPYDHHPDTAWLADVDLVDGDTILTGYDGLTAVYIPNMRPNKCWRDVPGAAALGRSDICGVEPLLDLLDRTLSSWERDIDLGKARLIVPAEYMRALGQGQGAEFEVDREIYEPIHGVMGSDERGLDIQEVQFQIRVEDHQRSVDSFKAMAVSAAGYSAATFGLDTEGPEQTATEVTAKKDKSALTRAKKIRYNRPALQDILQALLAVDAHVFRSGVTVARPQVTWPDAVAPDPLIEAQTLLALDQAMAISTEEKVRRLHPDWDADEVQAEVDLILEEKNIGPEALPDPSTFTAGGGFGQPAEDAQDEAEEPEAEDA